MGQGAKAGIGIHYDARTFPMDLEDIEARDGLSTEDVPGISPRLREHARTHHGHAGGPQETEEPASADD
jgi:thioredoxin reductase (NADPH)